MEQCQFAEIGFALQQKGHVGHAVMVLVFISMRHLSLGRFLLRVSGRDARALVRGLWIAFSGANSRRRQGSTAVGGLAA